MIYRIDHYLGKEPVQDIMALRFANVIFEPIWNRRYVDCIQITAAETVGVEGRGGYYDSAGALRDMIQNHVINLLALVAMEPPISPNADHIRDDLQARTLATPVATLDADTLAAYLRKPGEHQLLFVLGGERDVDRRQEAEDHHLHDDHERP